MLREIRDNRDFRKPLHGFSQLCPLILGSKGALEMCESAPQGAAFFLEPSTPHGPNMIVNRAPAEFGCNFNDQTARRKVSGGSSGSGGRDEGSRRPDFSDHRRDSRIGMVGSSRWHR